MQSASEIMQRARVQLSLRDEWALVSYLGMKMPLIERSNIKTLATDGTAIYFNPSFVEELAAVSFDHVITAQAHEIQHVRCLHHTRGRGLDHEQWNKATDYVINLSLRDAGFSIPEWALLDNRFRGMSAEQVYAHLENQGAPRESEQPDKPPPQHQPPESKEGQAEQNQQDEDASSSEQGREEDAGSDGHEESDPGGLGSVIQVQDDEASEQEAEWEAAEEIAKMVAQAMGVDPGGLLCDSSVERRRAASWRRKLRMKMQGFSKVRQSRRPNRRLQLHPDLVMPSLRRTGIGEMAVGFDTSGSIQPHLPMLFTQLMEIIKIYRPQKLHVAYFDTVLHRVDTYTLGQKPTWNPVGGGGSNGTVFFDYFKNKKLDVAVCITDSWMHWPDYTPSYPVLWGLTLPSNSHQIMLPDWGERIHIDVTTI